VVDLGPGAGPPGRVVAVGTVTERGSGSG